MEASTLARMADHRHHHQHQPHHHHHHHHQQQHSLANTQGAGQIDQGLELFRRMKAQGLKILGEDFQTRKLERPVERESEDNWW